MKIENPQVKLGLIQISDGLVTLLNAFRTLLGVEQNQSQASPTPAEGEAPAPKKNRGKAKDTAAVPETAPVAEASQTSAPASSDVFVALTHEDVKQVLFKYMNMPGVGKEKGKELILGTFKVNKFNEIPVETLPVVKATIEEAIKNAISASEEI